MTPFASATSWDPALLRPHGVLKLRRRLGPAAPPAAATSEPMGSNDYMGCGGPLGCGNTMGSGDAMRRRHGLGRPPELQGPHGLRASAVACAAAIPHHGLRRRQGLWRPHGLWYSASVGGRTAIDRTDGSRRLPTDRHALKLIGGFVATHADNAALNVSYSSTLTKLWSAMATATLEMSSGVTIAAGFSPEPLATQGPCRPTRCMG